MTALFLKRMTVSRDVASCRPTHEVIQCATLEMTRKLGSRTRLNGAVAHSLLYLLTGNYSNFCSCK